MKTVIVTGSSKGLGLNIVGHLLESGCRVVGVSRTLGVGQEQLLKKHEAMFFHYVYDFEKLDGIREFAKKLTKENGPIYGLVNNAALGLEGILGTMHESDIKKCIAVNVEAPILLTKYICRNMLLQQKGRIINIGSIIGSTGFNGLSVYGATKAALEGFTRSLARELGKAKITVNTICPGYMKTNMTQGISEHNLSRIEKRACLGRLAETGDVAAMVNHLLSESSGTITGTEITIDAGSTA